VLSNVTSNVTSIISQNSTNIANGLVYPLIIIALTSIGSGIRLYYLSLQGKNRYITLLKINFPHIDTFLKTIENFKRMSQVFFIEFLVIGAILGGLIEGILSLLLFVLIAFSKYIGYVIDSYNATFQSLVVFPIIICLSILIILKIYLLLSKHSIIERFLMFVFNFIRNNPKVTEFGELNDSQKIDYYVKWFFLGLIIGIYASSLIMLFEIFRYPGDFITFVSKYFLYYFLSIVFFILVSLGIIVLGVHYIDDLMFMSTDLLQQHSMKLSRNSIFPLDFDNYSHAYNCYNK
jgi:hypothetical protein